MKRRESPATAFQPEINRISATPITRQLYLQLRDAIMQGRLCAGHRLPSTRMAVGEWGVSRGVIAEAYDMLGIEGYIESRHGSGTYVVPDLPKCLREPAPSMPAIAPKTSTHFSPGAASVLGLSGLPMRQALPFVTGRLIHDARTSRTLRRIATRHLGFETDSYGDPQGLPELRSVVSQYLAASRGVRCDPDQIFITAGTQQALDLASRVLVAPGDTILMENPCYPPARAIFKLNGARLVGVPVDRHGMVTQELETLACERPVACYVTPSHQYPLGATLPLQRRLQLLQFARDSGCWIIEDDYDSEFRYEGHSIASLQGLDGSGQVLYTGAFSKALLPSFRTGYLVVPPDLVSAFRAVRPTLDVFPATLPQRIIADYLAEGHFSAHLRRLRDRLRASRDRLVETLMDRLHDHLTAETPQQGIYLTARSTGTWNDDVKLSRAASAVGVSVMPTSPMYVSNPQFDRIILGFSGLSDEETDKGLQLLLNTIHTLSRGK